METRDWLWIAGATTGTYGLVRVLTATERKKAVAKREKVIVETGKPSRDWVSLALAQKWAMIMARGHYDELSVSERVMPRLLTSDADVIMAWWRQAARRYIGEALILGHLDQDLNRAKKEFAAWMQYTGPMPIISITTFAEIGGDAPWELPFTVSEQFWYAIVRCAIQLHVHESVLTQGFFTQAWDALAYSIENFPQTIADFAAWVTQQSAHAIGAIARATGALTKAAVSGFFAGLIADPFVLVGVAGFGTWLYLKSRTPQHATLQNRLYRPRYQPRYRARLRGR